MAGWVLVGAAAAAYDVFAIKTKRCETLSCVAGRHPWITAAAVLALEYHFNAHRLRRRHA